MSDDIDGLVKYEYDFILEQKENFTALPEGIQDLKELFPIPVEVPFKYKKNNKYSRNRKYNSNNSNYSSNFEPLTKAENPWISSQFKDDVDDEEKLYKNIRLILNKITKDNFEKLSEKILDIPILTSTILDRVVELIHNKAINEPKFASLYSDLCSRIIEKAADFRIDDEELPISKLFKNSLISKCQKLFNDMNKQFSEEEKISFNDKYSEEDKHRKLIHANIIFIGTLYEFNIVPSKLIHCIFFKLFHIRLNREKNTVTVTVTDFIENKQLESNQIETELICILLTSIGENIYNKSKKSKKLTKTYFDKLSNIEKSNVQSRIRFMILDLLDLVKTWTDKELSD